MMTNNEILRVEGLSKSFNGEPILKNINFTVNKGEVVVIIGSSGCGKSTLLRCINMLEEPDTGHIYFNNEDIITNKNNEHIRCKMTMVFQQFNLFNNKNVLQNCTLAQIKVLKRKKAEAINIASENLKKVGMYEKRNDRVNKISGGQKQRVAIARALSMNPELILFDEPTSALDPEMVNEVLQVIKKLANEGMTMVIVTHEMNFTKEIADKVIFMDKGIIAVSGSSKEVFEESTNERLNKFLNKWVYLNRLFFLQKTW